MAGKGSTWPPFCGSDLEATAATMPARGEAKMSEIGEPSPESKSLARRRRRRLVSRTFFVICHWPASGTAGRVVRLTERAASTRSGVAHPASGSWMEERSRPHGLLLGPRFPGWVLVGVRGGSGSRCGFSMPGKEAPDARFVGARTFRRTNGGAWKVWRARSGGPSTEALAEEGGLPLPPVDSTGVRRRRRSSPFCTIQRGRCA